MKKIKIADITLRESEQVHSAKLSFKEKLETAKLLEKLQVDIIETGPVGNAPADAAFTRTLATTLEYCTLSAPVSLDKADIDSTWAALSKAKTPRLNLIIPTSTVGLEYQHQMKAEKVLPLASEAISYCASLCPDVEFTAEDAVRSEPVFLAKIIKAAIAAGAKTITLCDSVGELLPEELSKFISMVYENLPELRFVINDGSITLALHCKDNLGLASAAAINGINAGAGIIKVSAGSGLGTLSLEQFLNVIKVRGDTLGISSNVSTVALQRTCSRLAALTGTADRKRVSEIVESNGDDPKIPEISTIDQLRDHISSIGYDVSEDDIERIFSQFQDISRSKKVVNRDIEALIAETAGQAPPTYLLKTKNMTRHSRKTRI